MFCWLNGVHLGIVECIGAAFLCGEGKCIPEENVCDGTYDCDTDELNCKLCIYCKVTYNTLNVIVGYYCTLLELDLSFCQVEEFNML